MRKKGLSPGKIVWSRFIRNPLSLAGMGFILFAFFVSLLGYVIAPDKSVNSNTQVLEIATEKPGFRVTFLKVRQNRPLQEKGKVKSWFTGIDYPFQLVPVDSFWFESGNIIVKEYSKFKEDEFYREFQLPDVVYPVRNGETFLEGDRWNITMPDGSEREETIPELNRKIREEHLITKTFLLGTDRFGRDMLSRIIIGTRVSFSVGFIAVFISLLVGIILGGIAGYFRGVTDKIIMWLVNVVWSIPTLLMVIAITLVLGKGYWQVFVAVGLTMWVEVARVVRGQVISAREADYIEAARAIGVRPMAIIFRHILPNIIAPVIIISAANFATAILMEAGLSFLGIGVQPPVPSWGAMIKDHYGFIIVNKGYMAFIPGFAIMMMVLAFTLVGNGLRDALDSKSV
ncbi:MAG: ABC transporter permease [Bacteroidales bacterium]|nr:ABC transporter permease [Bacteroidales bacterium]